MAAPVEFGKPITDLPTHVTKLFERLPDSGQANGFEAEFKHLEKVSAEQDTKNNYDIANKIENRFKNRYNNVLPNEETRVVLQEIPNDPGSDYINANFITGEKSNKKRYISTQGPLAHTITDFWRMIWEQHVSVIVMLTKEVENGKIKCNRYWPEENTLTFDNITVTFVKRQEEPQLIVRTFTVTNAQSPDVTRELTQFQYTAWADHGLPVQSSFLNLLYLVDSYNTGGGPICVHCSAGIGRSGTFCAVHRIIHEMNDHVTQHNSLPTVNIVQTVLDMRQQRHGMVQTKEQYTFVYLAVLEHYNLIAAQVKKDGSTN